MGGKWHGVFCVCVWGGHSLRQESFGPEVVQKDSLNSDMVGIGGTRVDRVP